jgi:hypothetical protein
LHTYSKTILPEFLSAAEGGGIPKILAAFSLSLFGEEYSRIPWSSVRGK